MDSLSAAAQDVIARGMPLAKAARKHGVPRTERLGSRVRGGRAGRRRVLPRGQPQNHRREDSLVAVNHQLTTTRTIGQGVGFERTARITGYCAPVKRFCDAKKAELKDRVKHE